MAEKHRLRQAFGNSDADAFTSVNDGDCSAEPVPALWHQDDDEYFVESGFINRFWLPLSVAVLAGWGSLSFVLVSAFGWLVILAVAGIVIAGVSAAIFLVRTGDRNRVELTASNSMDQQDSGFRNVA